VSRILDRVTRERLGLAEGFDGSRVPKGRVDCRRKCNQGTGAACERRPAEELLTTPYDGGTRVGPRGDRIHAALDRPAEGAWHDVVVLEFMHSRFVLNRPGRTIYQRGQARVLEALVAGFHASLDDRDDAARAEWSGD
jgi:hypothetical protein